MVLLVGSTCFDPITMPNRPVYRAIGYQFQHRPWGGVTLYDLIMPAFLFMVGVSMSYSVGRRLEEGAERRKLFKHFLRRALILILVSEILISVETNHLHVQFHNILTQVAFTSVACFFIMQLRTRYQVVVAILLLAFHSSLYLVFPGNDGPFQPVTNFGSVLDRAIMGHNYRMAPAVNISTLSEIVNVLVGIWAGNLLRSPLMLTKKFSYLAAGAAIAFSCGLLLSPIVPINKWLWTASYTLVTSGWSLVGLMMFCYLDLVLHLRKELFFFVVVGMNSLLIYCIGEVLVYWVFHAIATLTPWLSITGEIAPAIQACATFLVIWLFAYWFYRRGIFLRA